MPIAINPDRNTLFSDLMNCLCMEVIYPRRLQPDPRFAQRQPWHGSLSLQDGHQAAVEGIWTAAGVIGRLCAGDG